jgi:hypothetical protein
MAFFSNLKPVPRFILIAVIVGGGVYGGSLVVDRLPKKAVAPVAEATLVPAESAQPAPVTSAPVALPAPQVAAPTATPAPKDAGLDALMK